MNFGMYNIPVILRTNERYFKLNIKILICYQLFNALLKLPVMMFTIKYVLIYATCSLPKYFAIILIANEIKPSMRLVMSGSFPIYMLQAL